MRVLCANGWAQPPDGLAALAGPGAYHLDYAPCDGLDAATAVIARDCPEADLAIGWSLGGAILLEALRRQRLRVPRLVLIAPALHFVATPAFPEAMDPLTFRLFCESYEKDPVRTAARFVALIAKGDRHALRILREHAAYEGASDKALWGKWLDRMTGYSFIENEINIDCEVLIFHGEGDAVVSIGQSHLWSSESPHRQLMTLPGCGHAPHWHDPERVGERIDVFVG